MSDFLDLLKEAEEFYWAAMEQVSGEDTYRVRCRHCQMVRDIEDDETPEMAFRRLEHYARKCRLIGVTAHIRKALKE